MGELSKEQKQMLKSESDCIKFSVDSIVKNRINHPEVIFSDYTKIGIILKIPDKIALFKIQR